MIILHQTLKDTKPRNNKNIGSPSSFFKLKWIEEQERNKTFDHLEVKEIDEAMQDRLHFKSSNISDFEKFQDIME